jgi:hypothetical protein
MRSSIEKSRQSSDLAVGGANSQNHPFRGSECEPRLFSEPRLEIVVPDDPKPGGLDGGGGREVRIGVEERQGPEVIPGTDQREGLAAKVGSVSRDLNATALDQVEVVLRFSLREHDFSRLDRTRPRHIHELSDMGLAEVFEENDGS